MTQRAFIAVSGIIFSVIALLHLLRILFGWEAVIAGWHVPRALSVLALLISGFLAYQASRLRKRGR